MSSNDPMTTPKSLQEYMEQHKDDAGTSGKRARLGLALSKMSKGKKK